MTDSRPLSPVPPPSGTVTFLFTDIEGSTEMAQQYPDALPALLARHHTILHAAIEAHHGYVFQIIGDSFHVAFHTAPDAIQAALDAQRLLQHETWNPAPIKVRMGINTGAAQAVGDDDRSGGYSGYSTLARVQRVMSTAYGGQVLLSNASADLVQSDLPAGVTLRDMGEHHLKGLTSLERLWQLAAPDLISDFPPLATLSVVPNNLPTQLTSFIGREKEIAEVKRLLLGTDAAAPPHRMVTLTAVGGTGKTRLSIEVGMQVLAEFPQGIWLIELAPLTSPAQIIPALAQVVGLKEIPSMPLAVTVADYLREKKALLILDNCEHLIEACARLADDWLHHCVHLKILASSREALGIAGEVAYHMPSLAETESVQLFVDRARAINSNFARTESNAAAIAQICNRLDGIPLAIELAAARAKVLTPEQISTRLNDRFHLLVGGSRTALPRQQTLRALIDWSYDLLSDAEKRLLQFASVFVGGWTLDALEAIADDPDTLELLEQLVNKSLVLAAGRDNEMRYSMLETIRQYAREKLFDTQQASAARDRHFSYFHDMAAGMWESLRNLKEFTLIQAKAFDELENMRAALDWGVEHQPVAALQLAANFTIFSTYTGSQYDGLDWLRLALGRFRALPSVDSEAIGTRQAALAKALFAQGWLSMINGNSQLSIQSLREAIVLARSLGDKRLLGRSLETYYTAGSFTAVPDGPAAAEEGFAIFNEIDDVWGNSVAFMNMARVAAARGDYEASRMYFDRVTTKLKATPVSFMTGIAYLNLSYAERDQGHLDIARQHLEEGLKVFKLLRHKSFEAVMLSEIGHNARAQGDAAQAHRIYRETITRFQDLGNRGAIAHQLECFAFIALSEAEPGRAVKLFAAASALRDKINALRTDLEQAEYDQAIAQLHSLLAEAVFDPLWAEGRSMPMEEAIQLALS